MEISLILVGILVFAAAFFLLTFIVRFRLPEPRYVRLSQERPTRVKKPSLLTLPIVRNLSRMINQPLRNMPYLKNIQDNANFLKLPVGAIEIMLLKELLMIGAGITGFMLIDPMWGVILALAGFLLPDFILGSKVSSKKDAMLRVFPEMVDILDLCIGAGLDFLSALRWVVEKSDPNPFVEQLEIVLNEISIGRSRSDALKDMALRVKVADINSFVRTIVQAERMGISIEEALRNLSEDTRMNRYQRGERMAIKAGLKMLIPLMVFILPVILIIVAGPVIIQFSQGDLIPNTGVTAQ